jgi:CheY-like chemotaxis protein
MVSRAGATILVVEDEPALRRTALRILGRLGYVAVLAECGEEAVERIKLGQVIDLVISDYHLPDTDGWRLLTRLRAAGYRGPFVLTSGSLEEDLPKGRPPEPGIPFLGKPFLLEEFARIVKDVLEGQAQASDGP